MNGNLYADLPAHPLAEERFDSLLSRPGLRITRIASTGQASPPGFWYDQDDDEWVVLLSGTAAVQFEAEPQPRTLAAGDWLYIPAHCRHRVAWTDAQVPSVWLALHFDAVVNNGAA